MEGYRIPPYDPATVDQGNGTASASTSDIALKAAPGVGLRVMATWIAITNTSPTGTRISVKSGSTTIAVIPAPASSAGSAGAVLSFPVPLVCAENEALNFACADSVTSVFVSVGVVVGPKA